MVHIKESPELPHELTRLHQEANLLWYSGSKLFAAYADADTEKPVGVIRVALRDDNKTHGLIADLHTDESEINRNEIEHALIQHAEKYLKSAGATKIDAVVLDGKKLTEPYLKSGYWASRKTVAIEWILKNIKTEAANMTGVEIQITDKINPAEVADFIINSYQPYYQWWKDDSFDRIWERIDYPAPTPDDVEQKNLSANRDKIIAMLKNFNTTNPQRFVIARKNGTIIGVCDAKITNEPHDENFDWGVLMTRDHPGKGFGQLLLLNALNWLKTEGIEIASALTTSGMDDFDPTVYLYTLSGGMIKGEFLNCVKHFVSKKE